MASVHLCFLLQSTPCEHTGHKPGSLCPRLLLTFSHAGLGFQASPSPPGVQPGEFTSSGEVLYKQEIADSKHRSLKPYSHLIKNSLNCFSSISLSKPTLLSGPAITTLALKTTLPCQCAPGKTALLPRSLCQRWQKEWCNGELYTGQAFGEFSISNSCFIFQAQSLVIFYTN